MKWPRTTLLVLVADWFLPIMGGSLTILLLHRLGLRSFWALLLVLPGALAFQWTVLFAIMGLERLLKRRR